MLHAEQHAFIEPHADLCECIFALRTLSLHTLSCCVFCLTLLPPTASVRLAIQKPQACVVQGLQGQQAPISSSLERRKSSTGVDSHRKQVVITTGLIEFEELQDVIGGGLLGPAVNTECHIRLQLPGHSVFLHAFEHNSAGLSS